MSLTLALLTSCYVATPHATTFRGCIGGNGVEGDIQTPEVDEDGDETAIDLSSDEDDADWFDLSDVNTDE